MSYLPSLPAAVGLIVGILAAPHVPVWVLAVVLIAAAGMLYRRRRHYVALLAFFVAVGLITERAHHPYDLPEELYNKSVVVQAVVQSAKERERTNIEVVRIIAIDSVPMPKILCQLSVLSGREPHPEGSVIAMKCKLTRVGDRAVLPYQVDYDRYLRAEGISCKAFMRGEGIKVIDSGEHSLWPYRAIQGIRNWLYNAIVLSPVDSQTASFLVATILGDGSLLSQDVTDAFRNTGVAHLLALSGLHVGILVWLFSVVLFPLGAMRRGRLVRSVLTVVVVWSYAVVVGMTPSIVRAAVMITVFIAANHIQRGYNAWNSLLLSVVFILCICPGWLTTPGFQLSVAAVAAILAFGTIVPSHLKRKPWIYYPLNMLLIPVAAMIGTGIIGAYYFGTFPWWFLVSNVITGLLFPPMLAVGVVMMVFTGCGMPIGWMGAVVQWLYHLLHGAVMWLDGFKGMTVTGLQPSAWTILMYFVTVALAAMAVNWGRFPLPPFASRLTRRRLWLYAAAMLTLTLAVERLSEMSAPSAEFYVSGDSYSSQVVLISSSRALIYLPAARTDAPVEVDRSLLRYALSRGCDSVEVVTAPWRLPPFDISDTRIIAGQHLVTLVTSDDIPSYTGRMPALHGGSTDAEGTHYALVTRGFTGKMAAIVRCLHPDTVLFGPDVHPSRRGRLIRECADTIPYRDLRKVPLAITW